MTRHDARDKEMKGSNHIRITYGVGDSASASPNVFQVCMSRIVCGVSVMSEHYLEDSRDQTNETSREADM